MAIDKDFRFTLRGRKYSFESFCNANPALSEEDAELFVSQALANGIAVSEEDPMVNKTARIMKDSEDVNESINVRETEISDEQHERDLRNKDSLKHKEVSFDFPSYNAAKKFYDAAIHEVAIPDEDVSFNGATNTVTFRNITDFELKKFTVIYNTQRVVRATTVNTNKAVRTATNIAGYVAKDIAAPIAQTTIRAGMSAAGSLLHTLVKTGSDIISTGVDCAKKTAQDIREDDSYKKAKGDLKKAGATVANKFSGFGYSDGIRIK